MSSRTRSTRSIATQERLAQAGRELFSTQGYEQTSTREICRSADVASATFFTYFPEKRALLFYLMRPLVKELAERAQSDSFESLDESACNAIEIICAGLAKERKLSRAYIQELLFVSRADQNQTEPWNDLLSVFSEIVERSIDRHALSINDKVALTHTLFSIFFSTTASWLGGALPSSHARKELVQRMIATAIGASASSRKRIYSSPPAAIKVAQLRG